METETATTIADEDYRSLVVDLLIERGTELRVVRGRVDTALRDLGEDHLDDVLLVVTELVTNVLDHTVGSGRLRVLRCLVPCRVSVEVDDSSSVWPVCGHSRLGENRGRGMVLVDKLSSGWGTRSGQAGGKTVFALVRCGEGGTSAGVCPSR